MEIQWCSDVHIHGLWWRFPPDLSWWASGTQKCWVWGSPEILVLQMLLLTTSQSSIETHSCLFYIPFISPPQHSPSEHISGSFKFFTSQVCEVSWPELVHSFISHFSSFLVMVFFFFSFSKPNRKLHFRVKSCLPLMLFLLVYLKLRNEQGESMAE